MHAIVQEQAPPATALVLWMPVRESDPPAAADDVAATLPGTALTHFYDRDRIAGEAITEPLGRAGGVAWDIYLVYGRDARWGETPPQPAAWLHQLGTSSWADPARYRWGESLEADLRAAVRALP